MKERLIEMLATNKGKEHLRKIIKALNPAVKCDRMNLDDCKETLMQFSFNKIKNVKV